MKKKESKHANTTKKKVRNDDVNHAIKQEKLKSKVLTFFLLQIPTSETKTNGLPK